MGEIERARGLKPPLCGVRVLDLTRALAGPYGTMLLGDLGAEILKVESPAEVDSTRGLPPFVAPQMSSYFASINRNKRGLTLNLKHPTGLRLFRRLAGRVDVIIDNFRPGTLGRLGIDYDDLRRDVNAGLVSCSISGFGSTGAYRSRSAFDLVVQAMGGAMSVTGEAGSPPVRLGLPMGDLAAGMFAAAGILAALCARHATGRGRHVEVSMLDSIVALLSYMGGHYLLTGEVPGPQGSGHQVNVPYQAFRTKDRWIVIAIFGERYWKELCDVLGIPQATTDRRFATAEERSKSRTELLALIEQILLTRTADEWLDAMLAKQIPCAPINTVDQVMEDPVIRERHMVVETLHPAYGSTRAPGNPVKVEGIADGVATPPPLPGEHTEAILQEYLDLDGAAIGTLRDEGVI